MQRSDDFRLELDTDSFPGMPSSYAMRPNGGGGEDNAFTFCAGGEGLGGTAASLH